MAKRKKHTRKDRAKKRIDLIQDMLKIKNFIDRQYLDPRTPIGKLKHKDKKFVENLILHGMSKKEAKADAYGDKGNGALQLMSKTHIAKAIATAMKKAGVTTGSIAKGLKAGMNACVTSTFEGEVNESDVPDHKTRLTYIKTAIAIMEASNRVVPGELIPEEGVDLGEDSETVEQDILTYLQDKHKTKDKAIVVEVIDKEKQGEVIGEEPEIDMEEIEKGFTSEGGDEEG